MTGEHRAFDWLARDISEVRTTGFFVIDGPTSASRLSTAANYRLPESYRSFVSQFGNVKLYKQVGGYALGVRAVPVEAVSKDGEELLCFGHYQDIQACFMKKLLTGAEESPVFESRASGLQKVADGFADWLRKRSSAVRKKIGQKRWAQIVAGPRPFTESETEKVKARKAFAWRWKGIDDNGDIIFEISNGSHTILPFYSLGVRSTDGGFAGRIWLPVSHITPGMSGLVKHEAYKRYIPRDKLEVYELPDPDPADRDEYWEFEAL